MAERNQQLWFHVIVIVMAIQTKEMRTKSDHRINDSNGIMLSLFLLLSGPRTRMMSVHRSGSSAMLLPSSLFSRPRIKKMCGCKVVDGSGAMSALFSLLSIRKMKMMSSYKDSSSGGAMLIPSLLLSRPRTKVTSGCIAVLCWHYHHHFTRR